jgi:hypothetical protein
MSIALKQGMNLQNLLKLTREKRYCFVVLLVGLSLPNVANFFLTIFVARTFGTEKYVEYLTFRTSVPSHLYRRIKSF